MMLLTGALLPLLFSVTLPPSVDLFNPDIDGCVSRQEVLAKFKIIPFLKTEVKDSTLNAYSSPTRDTTILVKYNNDNCAVVVVVVKNES